MKLSSHMTKIAKLNPENIGRNMTASEHAW